MCTEKETIYVRLLDEGTEVFRPTEAEKLDEFNYRVLAPADYDPADEHWEYPPGSIVKCRLQTRDGELIKIAAEE